MAPKRRNHRNNNLVVQSDYDTDTANLTDATPALAPPPARTNTELNLVVLRKYIPNIERIICIAPFAVVYTFSPDTQSWEKCGMEGTLFVCQLMDPVYPRWCALILNRKSMDNFFAELKSPEDVEITEEYVILQDVAEDGTPQIFGLWIFSDGKEAQNTREMVAQTIQQCAAWAESGRQQRGELNGSSYMEDSSELGYESQPPTEQEKPLGQQINLNQLFGAPMASFAGPVQPPQPVSSFQSHGGPPPGPQEQLQFYQQQQQYPQPHPQSHAPPTQQNALLSLFKAAR